MAAVRGGGAALLVVAAVMLLLLATACSAAVTPRRSGRLPPPKTSTSSTPGDPTKLPHNGKYITVNANRFKNRDYEIACRTDWGASCLIKCPARCPNKCLAYCAYCLTFCLCDFIPGTSCGDPRFTGGDGNTFYFHGKRDESFCLVSDPSLHINARFVGNRNAESGRDFTWVQALGITFFSTTSSNQQQQEEHRLYIGARKAAEWDEDEDHVAIVLDGEPVDVSPASRGARWRSAAVPGLTVTRTDAANAVVVELDGAFAVTANAVPVTNEDSQVHGYGKTRNDTLVHLDLGYSFHGLAADVDGVLGQTYRPNYVTKVDVTANNPVMGGADKYRSSGLFATDCAVSRFGRAPRAATAAAALTGFAS